LRFARRGKKVNIESDKGIDFGLLDCKTCHAEFPIVAGVMIAIGPDDFADIRDVVSETRIDSGVKPRLLCELLTADKPREAFSLLLTPCRPTPNFLAFPKVAKRGPGQRSRSRLLPAATTKPWRQTRTVPFPAHRQTGRVRFLHTAPAASPPASIRPVSRSKRSTGLGASPRDRLRQASRLSALQWIICLQPPDSSTRGRPS
jgi:hypothetical protein